MDGMTREQWQNICASISNNREFLHIYSGLTRHTPMCWRSLRGVGWRPIFWNGHLDTVPYGDTGEWKTDPAVPVERDGFLCPRCQRYEERACRDGVRAL